MITVGPEATEAITFALREGLQVTFVTEDTTRSSPDDLRVLLTAAIRAGATRVCLCDTCGAAVPDGAYNLVAWVSSLIAELGLRTTFFVVGQDAALPRINIDPA